MADTATQLPKTKRRARWPYFLAAAAVLAVISIKWLVPIGMEQRALAVIRAECPRVGIQIPSTTPPAPPPGASALSLLTHSTWMLSARKSTNLDADYVGPDFLREWTGHEFLRVRMIEGSAEDLRPAADQLHWLQDVVDVDLFGLEDEDAAYIGQLPRVKSLNLRSPFITDAGLSRFGEITNLRRLILPHAYINGRGFKAFSSMEQLEELDLTNTQLNDEGLGYVCKLNGLKSLQFVGTRVTDDGLVHLKNLPRLESLMLLGLPITDNGLKHLSDLKQLKTLSLLETKVTDAGLPYLLTLDNLEDLDLSETAVTLDGVRQLQVLHNLCRLRLGGFGMTNAQRDELQQALPGCEVTRY
ncbi:Leucine Rich repeats (2 copies) [Symmachiella dynata]|uniref:Leucine Rich repeats (2 copies) n=1 Tax=Symmachiella dynata TaxID=2527995 RepID=A0A517ZXI7_9PLAN|nr:hypothetical protein [Symmachiella dynata]QDU47178.1 Leucine Rich repeats (2 copies) [Symmachiella dynata]